jgi:hypothetical protein
MLVAVSSPQLLFLLFVCLCNVFVTSFVRTLNAFSACIRLHKQRFHAAFARFVVSCFLLASTGDNVAPWATCREAMVGEVASLQRLSSRHFGRDAWPKWQRWWFICDWFDSHRCSDPNSLDGAVKYVGLHFRGACNFQQASAPPFSRWLAADSAAFDYASRSQYEVLGTTVVGADVKPFLKASS